MTFIAHLNYLPLSIIAGVVIIDLVLRYFIFGRLESAAIDIALFTTIYCIVEVARSFGEESFNRHELAYWCIKLTISAISMIILGAFHMRSERELERVVEDVINDTRNKTKDAQAKQLLDAAKPLITRSILVSFTPPESMLRLGKRNWRAEAAHLMNLISALKSKDELQQEDLTLPQSTRYSGLILFGFLSALCVLIVGIPH